jgi:GT2 family glycosyltransferase
MNIRTNHADEVPPALSVVIINWNKSSLTLKSVENIREQTNSVPYEIIVVDNGSEPDQKTILQEGCRLLGATLISLCRNLFFGEANNIGVEAARANNVLLVNNDVVLPQGYVDPLLASLESAFQAGAVGPRFLYPNGRLQEAGSYIRADGWTLQHGKIDKPNTLIAGPGLHIVDYCSAACLLLRRDVFLSIGGFDPIFEPAYFEDVDLCLRLRSIGLFTYYCGDVEVIHHEGASTAELGSEMLNGIISENHRKFLDRWGTHLRRRLESEAEIAPTARIIWRPEPDSAQSEKTIYLRGKGLVRDTLVWNLVLQTAAHLSVSRHVVLVADEACSRSRIYTLLSRLGLEIPVFSVRRFAKEISDESNTLITFSDSRSEAAGMDISGPLAGEVIEVLRTNMTP